MNVLTAVNSVFGDTSDHTTQRKKLGDYLDQFMLPAPSRVSQSAMTALAPTTAAGSRDPQPAQVTAITRAGPCPGYQNLVCLSYLLEKAEDIKHQRLPELAQLTRREA